MPRKNQKQELENLLTQILGGSAPRVVPRKVKGTTVRATKSRNASTKRFPTPHPAIPSELKPQGPCTCQCGSGNPLISEVKVEKKLNQTNHKEKIVPNPQLKDVNSKKLTVKPVTREYGQQKLLDQINNLQSFIEEEPTYTDTIDSNLEPRKSVAIRGGDEYYNTYGRAGKKGRGFPRPGVAFP